MKIDVIICTFNRSEKLREAIRSLCYAWQSDDDAVRLIVVDNNSTDGTEGVVQEFFGNGPGIKIEYIFEEKQGKSHALNKAIKHSTGDLVAFTDDDVTVDRGWVREMVNALGRYPDINCFGGRVMAVYPAHLPHWLDTEGPMAFLRSAFVDRDDGDGEIDYEANVFSKTPGGCNMFFRTAAIEMNGPFRTDLGPSGSKFGFSEDTEYCRRLIGRGERFMYIPSAIVYHPVHEGRLRKAYLFGWQYACGKSEVRGSGGYKGSVKAFGVPRYLFKKLINHFTGWWLSLSAKKRFYHKLRLSYTVGEIVEHLRLKRGGP